MLENVKDFQRIFVCGPPVMNEGFHTYMTQLKKEKFSFLGVHNFEVL